MKNLAVALVVATVGFAAAPAGADSPVTTRVFDQGRHVLVEVTGLSAGAERVASRSDRIEVPVANGLAHGARLEVEDETIKRVFFEPGRRAVVSIQMRHGADTTAKLAKHSSIEQAGDTLRIRLPRRRRHITAATPEAPVEVATELVDGPARAIEPPANPAAPAQAVAAPAPVAPTSTPASVPEIEEPAPAAASAAEPATEAAPTRNAEDIIAALGTADGGDDRDGSGTAGTVDAQPAQALGGATGGGGSLGLVLVILAACAGAAWFARRRGKGAPAVDPLLSVIAEKSLGARAKVVLLSAGDREILLAVGDKEGPQLLGQWPTGERRPSIAQDLEPVAAPEPSEDSESARDKLDSLRRAAFGTSRQPVVGGPNFAASLDKARSSYSRVSSKAAAAKAPTVNAHSPSIAGLLKLRGDQPVLSGDMTSADPEADAEWAAELLAATAARGGRN